MIDFTPYKRRTHKQLHNMLRKWLNALQMRDWQVELIFDTIPEEIAQGKVQPGGVTYQTETLQAKIWIDIDQCKAINEDPLYILGHEVTHIWLDVGHDEELQCNTLSQILNRG